jgi:hypothetical protein
MKKFHFNQKITLQSENSFQSENYASIRKFHFNQKISLQSKNFASIRKFQLIIQLICFLPETEGIDRTVLLKGIPVE